MAGAQWVIPPIMPAKQASAECMVYIVYIVRMVHIWCYRVYMVRFVYFFVRMVYGILLNVHAKQASEFGAACTECGKGYKIVITKSETICAACTECGGTDHDPGSKMLQR